MRRLFGIWVVAALNLSLSGVVAHATVTTLNWTSVSTVQSPPGREFAYMDFDSKRGRTVLFGGDLIQPSSGTLPPPYFNDTWEWDGSAWTQASPAQSPPGLTAGAMAFDSGRGVSVLFGGSLTNGQAISATWEYDGATWTQRNLAPSPSARVWNTMTYDSARGRVVLFGGVGPGGMLGDTWEYDGTTWTQRFPATAPPPRYGAAMAFDSVRKRVVMFGGHNDGIGRLSDTWEWDGDNWVQRVSSVTPYPRQFHTMVFDSALGRTLMFGGDFLKPYQLGPSNDTWEWDGSQWTRDWTATDPTPTLGQAMAYDSGRDRTVLLGGTNGVAPQVFYNQTWEMGDGIVTPPGTPAATLGSGPVEFGSVEVGQTSFPSPVFLKSTGTGPLVVSSISISGDFAFTLNDCPQGGNPLAAGSSCLLVVTFNPTAAGDRTGSITVVDNESGGGQTLALDGTGTPILTTLAVSNAEGPYGGTADLAATLTAGGVPVAGATVTFGLSNGASQSAQTDQRGIARWTGASLGGLHAGSYPGGVQASFGGDQRFSASAGSAYLAVSQQGSMAWTGDFFVSDTTVPGVAATVDQLTPSSDPQFIDYSQLSVPVCFTFSAPTSGGLLTCGGVVDASDWASTGRGIVTGSGAALPDGAYLVTATLEAAGFPPGHFVVGDDLRVGLVSAPTKGANLSGGGAIAADPSANTSDTHGYFAFMLEPGRTGQGNLVYAYRVRMNVGAAGMRDVDVIVTSTDVASLDGNQLKATASGHVNVAFVDSRSGAHYAAFAFSGGTFKLSVAVGGTKSPDAFALALYRPDGTLFHATAALNAHGDPQQVQVALGSIVSSL